MNILFDRETLTVVGTGRTPLPFELEIRNVEVTSLTKSVSYMEQVHAVDEEGKFLYYLPQPPIIEKKIVPVKVETITKTSEPVLEVELKRVPLLGDDGKQVSYERTVTQYTPAVLDEEGNVVEEEKYEEIGTGEIIPCYVMEEMEVHKTDDQLRKLYYKEIKEETEIITPQEDIIITEDDGRLVGGLKSVMEEVPRSKTVSFEESPYEFTLQDILQYKYLNLVNESQMDGILVEAFTDESNIDTTYTSHSGNTGFGFVSLPPSGKVKTVKYQLSEPQSIFTLLEMDADEGIDIRYGNTIITKDKPLTLSTAVDKISFILTNKSDKPRDIRSFAIGY